MRSDSVTPNACRVASQQKDQFSPEIFYLAVEKKHNTYTNALLLSKPFIFIIAIEGFVIFAQRILSMASWYQERLVGESYCIIYVYDMYRLVHIF